MPSLLNHYGWGRSALHRCGWRLTTSVGVAILCMIAVSAFGRLAGNSWTAPAPALKPGDIQLQVILDQTPSFVFPTDYVGVAAKIILTRNTATPVRGKLRIGGPIGKTTKQNDSLEFDFDLANTNLATINARLSVTPAEESERITYPFIVVAGSETYLTMDLAVCRQPVWHLIGPFEGGPETAHNKVFPPE